MLTSDTVKHLIEQARNKGFISKGKPGRGGAKVTSRDFAVLISGALAGDTPQTATDKIGLIVDLSVGDAGFAVHFPTFGEESEWWNVSFIEALTALIDRCRQDQDASLEDTTISIVRAPVFYASIAWEDAPWDKHVVVSYELEETDERRFISKGRRLARVSLNGDFLRMAADWLEDRSPFCEIAPYRDQGRAL